MTEMTNGDKPAARTRLDAPSYESVVAACRWATQTSGRGLLGVSESDRALRVTFSSWPRQQEALRAVLDLGYAASADNELSLVVTGWDSELLVQRADRAQVELRALEVVAPRTVLVEAIGLVEELVPDDDGSADAAMRSALAGRYNTVRPFLTLLGESSALRAAPGGERVLRAVRQLPELARRRVGQKPLAPNEIDTEVVTPAWRRAVYTSPDLPSGVVDRDAYVVCVLEQLHRALGRRDVFAQPSQRWADPRAQLLSGAEWAAVREDALAGLSLTDPAPVHLARQVIALDAAWRLTAARLGEAGDNARVRVDTVADGRARLRVDHLDALGEPDSLVRLRKITQAMLPRVDLPDLLLEVHAWTGFLDAYTHLAEASTRTKDLPVSVAALLVAEACNVGLTPVIKPGDPALTRARLAHVDQYYVRADTHAAANAVLIGAQARIAIARRGAAGWLPPSTGCGSWSRCEPSTPPRRRGTSVSKRGITWLNAVNDQVAGIGQMVVAGTMRDSLFILDTLLNLDAGPRPEMVTTDNASYSDIVFGLFADPGLPVLPAVRRPARPAVLAGPAARRAGHRLRAVEGDRPQHHQPHQDRTTVAGHAARRRLPGHESGPCLRPAAHVRPRRAPHPARAGVRRVRPDRQDAAPARPGRPC